MKTTTVSLLAIALFAAGAAVGQTNPPPAKAPAPAAAAPAKAPAPAAAAPAKAPAPAAAAPAAAPAAPTAPAAAAPAAAVNWKGMSAAEKKKYMKETVAPKMKELFVAFDAKHYAKMDCKTCHGEGAVSGKFKMPNPKLPKLPADEEGFKKLAAEKPAVAEFMGTKVKPVMAQLLGLPEWTPQTPTGFGCIGCHTMVKPKAAPKEAAAKDKAAAPKEAPAKAAP